MTNMLQHLLRCYQMCDRSHLLARLFIYFFLFARACFCKILNFDWLMIKSCITIFHPILQFAAHNAAKKKMVADRTVQSYNTVENIAGITILEGWPLCAQYWHLHRHNYLWVKSRWWQVSFPIPSLPRKRENCPWFSFVLFNKTFLKLCLLGP